MGQPSVGVAGSGWSRRKATEAPADLMWAPAPSRRAGALGGRHRCRGSADTIDIAPPERHAKAPIRWTITTVIVRRMRPTTQLHRHRFETPCMATAKLRCSFIQVLFENCDYLNMTFALHAPIRIK